MRMMVVITIGSISCIRDFFPIWLPVTVRMEESLPNIVPIYTDHGVFIHYDPEGSNRYGGWSA